MTEESGELEYAGFWIRTVAAIIDTLLISVILFPLLTAIYGSDYWSGERLIQGPLDFLLSCHDPAVRRHPLGGVRSAQTGLA
jgi:uncharacterized RDD family membrane protein YckC